MEVSAIGTVNGVHWRLNAAAGVWKSTSICVVGAVSH